GDNKAQYQGREGHKEAVLQVKGAEESCHRGYLGISILSRICFTTSTEVRPSISRSGLGTIRWPSTGIATFLMSSGLTKFRPLMAARALEALRMAMEARGEAPR